MTGCPSLRSFVVPALALALSLSASACGKKGDPTLKSFEQPQAPSQLRAIHRENQIILLWDYPRDQEAKLSDFIIYKSAGSDFEKLTHTERSVKTYVDTEIKPGTAYQYKVIAQNFRGVYSQESNVVSVTPGSVPDAPHSLSLTFKGNSIIVSWGHEAKDVSFNVYKSTDKDKFGLTPLNSTPVTERFITDSLNTQRVVYYTVRALAGSVIRQEGPASSVLIMDPGDLVPGAPRGLQHLASEDKVFLSWEGPGEPWLKGFRVYRRDPDDDWRVIGETQVPSYIDSESPKIRRDYRVHALGPINEGPGIEVRNVVFKPQR